MSKREQEKVRESKRGQERAYESQIEQKTGRERKGKEQRNSCYALRRGGEENKMLRHLHYQN